MRGEESPSCPRCGYDLTGIAKSWKESCPIDGICSECGLNYAWADVLNPMLTVPSWSYEHTLRRPACRKALPTIWRVLRPWSFWSRMKLSHPIRAVRLFLLASVILVLMHVANAATYSWFVYQEASYAARGGTLAKGATAESLTRRAAIMPYSSIRIESPSYSTVILPEIQSVLLFLAAWLAATPLGYLLLGTSLTRARVRKGHLLRIVCYSTVLLPQFALIILIAQGVPRLHRFLDPFGGNFLEVPWLPVIGIPVLFVTYWWFAVRNYLKLPHSFAVAFLMSLLSFLAVLAGASLIHSIVSMFM